MKSTIISSKINMLWKPNLVSFLLLALSEDMAVVASRIEKTL